MIVPEVFVNRISNSPSTHLRFLGVLSAHCFYVALHLAVWISSLPRYGSVPTRIVSLNLFVRCCCHQTTSFFLHCPSVHIPRQTVSNNIRIINEKILSHDEDQLIQTSNINRTIQLPSF